MALLNSEDTFLHYRYIVKELFVLYDNETIEIPEERLSSFFILNNYIENLFPVIRLSLILDASTYYNILANKDTVKFKIRLQKFYRKNNNHEIESLYDDYISKTFSLILDDNDEDFEKVIRNLKYGDDEANNLFASKNKVEFFLFDSDLMKRMKTTINTILENANVTNAISYIASRLNINNLLMSKADNITIYDQLMIPPMNLSSALAYIDTFYGIHEKGSITYFGLERGYIVKFEGNCSAYEVNEKKEVTIIVPRIATTLNNNIGSLKRKDQPESIFFVTDPTTVTFHDETVTNDILKGKEVRIINLYNGEIENTLEDDEDGRKEIITNRGENRYFKSVHTAQILSGESVINITFEDIDLSLLTPNKKFKFVFEDTELSNKYMGSYILSKCDISLVRTTNELKAVALCIFRKS